MRPQRTGGHLFAAECRDTARCLGATRRVWVVRVHELGDPLQGIPPTKARPLLTYRMAAMWHPDGMTLALLER